MRRAAVLIALAVAGARPAAAACTLARADGPCLTTAASLAGAPTVDPWLDHGAALPLPPPAPPPDHRIAAAAAVGGMYLTFSAWAYLAWYRDVQSLDEFGWGGDGWFGRDTYAGGADKLGHAWATMVLARMTTTTLRWGGFGRTSAAAAGSALSWALFLAVEVKDGFYYKFSPGDLTLNTAGAVLAALLDLSPAADRLLDFRVQYYPSDEYLGLWRGEYHGPKKGNSLNVAEDYSGETYFLGVHLAAVPRPRATPTWLGTALDYVEVGVGFGTRKYKPDAAEGAVPTQTLFVGATLDLQYAIDRALGGSRRRAARVGRAISHGVLEVMAPPFSLVPVVGVRRSASGPAPEQ